MTEDAARRRELAARAIARHISRIQMDWMEIDSLNRMIPDAPVGESWDQLRKIANQITSMFKEIDNG